MLVPGFLAPLLAQPVAVLGGGVSGDGVRTLVAALGADSIVYDQQSGRGGEFTAPAAARHALVVYSPGFPTEHPWLARARSAGAECLGELDFASVFWTGRLVAVTGTNGKTTLTEFLTHALRSVGRAAHPTGNIGDPFSRLVADAAGGTRESIAVCEVSSFQAESLRHLRADATLWTNFAEDHLERHSTLQNYFAAKSALLAHTDPDSRFIGSSVQRYAREFGQSTAGLALIPTEGLPPDPKLDGTPFASYPQRENFLLAAGWWRANGLDLAEIYAAARTFRLGRHRLSPVVEVRGVTFWNDSKATNFHAVEAALSGFSAPVILIAGGRSKGGDLRGFVQRIALRVKHVALIGETSAEMALHLAALRVPHTACANLAEAVSRAVEVASAGEHVLLSPGFASFDQFRNYEDRGDQFERLVRANGRGHAPAGV